MNQEERDRLVWLRQARKQQITQREAAERMEVTERWVRKLLARMRVARDRVVVHGLRGRPSNRKLAVKTEQKAMAIVRAEYSDFGPTLAAEYVSQHHDIAVSRETMRQWMMRAGIVKRRNQRLEEIHVWRQRRSAGGELVQWDTSEHDWLEGRGERIYYVAMIDDASGRVLARFVRHDGTAENMKLLWSYLERYGRPVATPIGTACSRPAGRSGTGRNRRWEKHTSAERWRNWGSAGLGLAVRRPRGVWNGILTPLRTGWSRVCAKLGCTRSKEPMNT